jgi:cytochrome oxidase assembly protein ShyY1
MADDVAVMKAIVKDLIATIPARLDAAAQAGFDAATKFYTDRGELITPERGFVSSKVTNIRDADGNLVMMAEEHIRLAPDPKPWPETKAARVPPKAKPAKRIGFGSA